MEIPFHLILNFANKYPQEVEKAADKFFSKVKADDCIGDEKTAAMFFSEWLVFDYYRGNKPSFLIEYLLVNPDQLKEKELSVFHKIGESMRFLQMEIKEIKRGEYLDTEDVFTGENYRIYDKSASATMPREGMFYARIGEAENKWYFIGAMPLYFPVTMTARMKRMIRRKKVKEKINFLEIINLYLTKKSESQDLVSKLSSRQLIEKRRDLENHYRAAAKKFRGAMSFKELINFIYNENRKDILIFWKELIKKGLTEKLFLSHTQLIMDIWNYFPHKCLDNKSPYEMSFENITRGEIKL